MSEEDISLEDWDSYLVKLYDWIQEKYNLMIDNGVDYTEAEYIKDLEYYDSEKIRIQKLIDEEAANPTESSDIKLEQSTFENFFGVTMEDEGPSSNPFEEVDNGEKGIPIPEVKPETVYEKPSDLVVDPVLEDSISKSLSIYADEKDVDNRLVNYEEETDIVDFSVFERTDPSESKTVYSNIMLLGDSSSGRTSIRRAWMGRHFVDSHLSTIGADMDKKQILIDQKIHHVTLIDLGGQDFYKSLRSNFYRKVDGAVIVFDLTDRASFMRLDYWVKEYYRSIKSLKPFMIIGNKKDLKGRKVKYEEGERVADNYSRYTMPKFKVKYLEVSAKDSTNINELFEMVLRESNSFARARARERKLKSKK